MAPIEFRHRSTCNYIGTWTIIKMESQRMVLKQKLFLLANMLTPLLYFFFIINALSPMLGTVRFDGHSVNYEAYALVGLMAMNLIGQMGKTMYRISSDRKNGLFALKMDAGLHPMLYIMAMGVSPIWGYLLQMVCFYILMAICQIFISAWIFLLLTIVGLVALVFWICLGTALAFYLGQKTSWQMGVNFLMLLLSFSAPSFYSYNDAPVYIQQLSMLNPLTYQLEAMRTVLFASLSWDILGKMAGFSVVSFFIAAWVTGRASLVDRKI